LANKRICVHFELKMHFTVKLHEHLYFEANTNSKMSKKFVTKSTLSVLLLYHFSLMQCFVRSLHHEMFFLPRNAPKGVWRITVTDPTSRK